MQISPIQYTESQKKKLIRLARITNAKDDDQDEIVIAEELNEIYDELDKLCERMEGLRGEKGEDGKDAVVDYPLIVNEVLSQMPPPIKGEKGDTTIVEKVIEKTTEVVVKEQPIVTNQIVKEIVTEFDTTEIDNKIKELQQMIENLRKIPQNRSIFGGRVGIQVLGSNTKIGTKANEINFGTGLSVTEANGRITVSNNGTATAYTETPSGTINGSNVTFTVLHSITTVFNFSLNGQYIHPNEYSTLGSTITFVTAPDSSLSGLPFTIVYQ